jgi:peptidoglycan/xylan/chitin deacetylase (PgdA/CDA1 family)
MILLYHSISEDEPSDAFGVSETAFNDQISWLRDEGYEFISLAALVRSLKDGVRSSTRKQVVLTFDDGYQDFLTRALPLLAGHRIPATVFLVTGMLGQTAVWKSDGSCARLMTEEEVRLAKGQGIGLGSHTMTHADLTALGDEELRRQLVDSRQALTDLGETLHAFSYPWGSHTEREVVAVRKAGYQCALLAGGQIRAGDVDLFRLGRFPVSRELGLDSFRRGIIGPGWCERLVRRTRAWVRSAVGRAR